MNYNEIAKFLFEKKEKESTIFKPRLNKSSIKRISIIELRNGKYLVYLNTGCMCKHDSYSKALKINIENNDWIKSKNQYSLPQIDSLDCEDLENALITKSICHPKIPVLV